MYTFMYLANNQGVYRKNGRQKVSDYSLQISRIVLSEQSVSLHGTHGSWRKINSQQTNNRSEISFSLPKNKQQNSGSLK